MAVLNKIKNASLEDVYDTQNALDKGILSQVTVPVVNSTTYTEKGGWQNLNRSNTVSSNADELFNKDNLGSILGMTSAIDANRKKRTEQAQAGQAGFGPQASILGGGQF